MSEWDRERKEEIERKNKELVSEVSMSILESEKDKYIERNLYRV